MAVRIYLEIGHEAAIRTKKTQEGFTHDWEVFVRGLDGAEIQFFVEKVVFYLHETFTKPKRVIREPPFLVKESGYAGFTLPIDIYLKNSSEPKKIRFNYDLHLQTQGPPIIKVQKEKFVFSNPPEDFRIKVLKGGGIVGSSSSSQEISESRSSFDDKNQMTNKPKLSGSSSNMKKIKIKPASESCKDFQELFGSPITMPTKSSESKVQNTKVDSKRTKHSPHKEKSSSKPDSSEKKKEEKKQKERTKDRERSKDKGPKKEKSPRPKSPSPKKITPPRFSSPPSVKHKDSKHDRERKEKEEKKVKKEKKHKEELKEDYKKIEKKKEEFKGKVEPEKKKFKEEKSPSEKYKHKKKEKEKREKKEEKVYKVVEKPKPVEIVKAPVFKAEEKPVKKEKPPPPPPLDDDSSSSSSSSVSSVEKKPPKDTPKLIIKDDNKSEKIKKEKVYQDSGIKCKRKSNSVDEDEPIEKIRKEADDMEDKEQKPTTDDDYFGILKDLQHKIMGLKDKTDLQKIVQLIAETGRFEVSANTFDFDLCLLDRSTVKQLQEFFANES